MKYLDILLSIILFSIMVTRILAFDTIYTPEQLRVKYYNYVVVEEESYFFVGDFFTVVNPENKVTSVFVSDLIKMHYSVGDTIR